MNPEQAQADIERQIELAIADFVTKQAQFDRLPVEAHLVAGFLSGASLTAHFIVGNDGSEWVTPTNVERAIENVARRFGCVKGEIE